VAYEDGIQDFKFGNETNNTVWINSDNMYIVDREQIENIYNQLNNLECYSFEGSAIIDPSLDIGDIVTIDNKKVVYQSDMEYVGKFKASIDSRIQAKSKEETTRTVVSDKTKIRRVQSEINQIDGKITQLVQETGQFDEKISKVEQAVDGIKQSVEKMEDFTREKTQIENLYINDIAEGEGYLLDFKIYGDTIFFNSKEITICVSLKPRGYGESVYILTENEEDLLTEDGQQLIAGSASYYIFSKKITLNHVLRSLKIAEETYCDILEILQDGTIQIIRKIGIDDNGSLYLLTKEEIEPINEKLIIPSVKGDMYYFIKECANLKYYAKYIIENDYSKTFLTKLELGTMIEQNAEAVKVAWNQISDFIQLMIVNNNASMAILDNDKKVIMSLDKTGQHFYKEDGVNVFGEIGVKTIEEQDSNGNDVKNRYINFSIEGEYEKKINEGMAWGITTKTDNKFHPVLYIRNFAMGEQNSDASYGELELRSCNLVLNGFGTGIKTGGVLINGDPGEQEGIFFWDINNSRNLLRISPDNWNEYANITILDNIKFYRNQAGSNSFKLGDNNDNYCLFTDDGSIHCKEMITLGDFSLFGNLQAFGHIYCNNGVEPFSLAEKKKNIQRYNKKAIEEIKNTDIYYYNYKEDEENCKRRVGAIIGEDYNCSKEIIGTEGKGIDMYSMLSIAYEAIQEQQEQIEQLQEKDKQKEKTIQNLLERIEKLEEEKNGD
jgi:predicted nuclease with TOPRIM domain